MTPGPPEPGLDRRAVALAGHCGDESTARAGLHDADASVRATALGALERLGALDDATLVHALADADPTVRRRASAVVAGHRNVDLRAVLDDDEPAVAEVAAWSCGERSKSDHAVIERLVELAGGARTGRDPLVRESAVAALGAIGDDRGLDAILAATTDKPAVRRRAVLALAPFVGPDHPRATDVAAVLAAAVADRDWQVRQAAEDISPTADPDSDPLESRSP